MGSAPAGGSFESRLGSSARRGAYVGIGVPGTYRVTRSRTTQAQSLRRARANPNPWIQPDDMALHRNMSKVGGQAHDAYVDDEDVILTYQPGTPYVFAPDNYPQAGKVGGLGFRWWAGVAFFRLAGLEASAVFTPDMGDWPPGATGVEFENTDGVMVPGTCHMVGTLRWSRSVGDTQTWGVTVRRYPRGGYDFSGFDPILPGDHDYHEPETNPDLPVLYSTGDVIASLAALPGATTADYDWPVADPDDEGWIGVFVLPNASFAAVLADLGYADDDSIHAVDLSNDGDTTPYVEATFTPPRYRYTF